MACFFIESVERFASFRLLAFPEIDERFLKFGVSAVARVVGDDDGIVIFIARAGIIAHEGGSVSKSVMRRNVSGINVQGGGIMLERAFVVTGEAKDFTERVFGIGRVRQQFGVTL